jgi:hypothetical protein
VGVFVRLSSLVGARDGNTERETVGVAVAPQAAREIARTRIAMTRSRFIASLRDLALFCLFTLGRICACTRAVQHHSANTIHHIGCACNSDLQNGRGNCI